MKKEAKEKHFVKKPIYKGGNTAMRKFISKELRYPKEAFDAKIEGTVHLQYHINRKGKVVKTKIIQSLGYGCDQEAERVVKLLKFEIDKNFRKMYFIKKINIHFRLPKVKKTSNQQFNINYVSPSSEKTDSTEKPKKPSTSYTIIINPQNS